MSTKTDRRKPVKSAAESIILRNRYLVVCFDDRSGKLTHLSTRGPRKATKGTTAASPSGDSLIEAVNFNYHDVAAGQIITDTPPADGAADNKWSKVSSRSEPGRYETCHRTDQLEVTMIWSLPADSPLLRVTVRVRGTGVPTQIRMPNLPEVRLSKRFVDTFEDDKDLFFDGAELGRGMELPCWRVFFQQGYQSGLLLATRSKRDMSRFNLRADGFQLWPHTQFNYSTSGIMKLPLIDLGPGQVHEAAFEVGPWRARDHDRILQAAELDRPVEVISAPPIGKPMPVSRLKGHVYYATDLVRARHVTAGYHPGKWMVAEMPWAQRGRALVANTGVRPPALKLDAKHVGPHRVFVGIANGAGATLKIHGEPEVRYRIESAHGSTDRTAFEPILSGRHRPVETDFGVIDLDGKPIEIGRYPSTLSPCVIDYIRLVPLTPAQQRRHASFQATKPVLPLSGLNDIPDIASFTDPADPDPAAYSANIWEHAQCKFDKIYWRIDGQCSDYPSKHNTMRYVSAKVHSVYSPRAKAYGRALKKVDMLRLGVDAGKRYGVGLWGWMRFNNYSGNVASDFFRDNPKFHDEWESGKPAAKLCLAFPEVRKHKIDILVEAAGYGLDGICLGFLRHPPVLNYAPILVAGYRKQFGENPPREPMHPDGLHRRSFPHRDDPAYEQWWRYRAGYLTTFGRELKQALRDAGHGRLPIAIWVRPNHCLFDGIDIETWLSERLCDEVVSDSYNADTSTELAWETPQWKKLVQSYVPLIRGIPMNITKAKACVTRILRDGYDGICTYESDYTVLDPAFVELYESLRRP